MRVLGALALALVLGACARGAAVRTSANTMIGQTSAAAVCGGQGALAASQRLAAIETIRAGYDRYIITGGEAQNNVRVSQMPGTYNTKAPTDAASIKRQRPTSRIPPLCLARMTRALPS